MVEVYINQNFRTTHERIAFDNLETQLRDKWGNGDELIILLGNFECIGNEIDAVVVKPDAIIILELKDYGGAIRLSENGNWTADSIAIASSKYANPFLQLRNYRNKFIEFLTAKEEIILSKNNSVDWRRTSGFIVFHKEFEMVNVQDGFFGRNRWLQLTHLNELTQLINQTTSDRINLTKNEIRKIPLELGLKIRTTSKVKVKEDINSLLKLYEFLVELNQLLKVDKFIDKDYDILIKKHNIFIDHFYEKPELKNHAHEPQIRYNIENKLRLFEKKIETIRSNKKDDLIQKIFNANAGANYYVDKLVATEDREKTLESFELTNSLIRKIEKKYKHEVKAKNVNIDFIKAAEIFLYERGVFSSSLINEISREFTLGEHELQHLNGIFEILKLWFTDDMIYHWEDRNEPEKQGTRINRQTGKSEKFTEPARRARTEHKAARGFSEEWINNFEAKFNQKINIQNGSSSSNLITRVQIPLQISKTLKNLFLSLKDKMDKEKFNALIHFSKLGWLENEYIGIEDVYLTELRTNFVYDFQKDLDFLRMPYIESPNKLIYQPTYISILEIFGNWMLGTNTDQDLYKSSYKFLNHDLIHEIEAITTAWEPYKSPYTNKGDYTGTNQLTIDEVAKELKIKPKELKEFLDKTRKDLRYGKFGEYNIGDRYYILALKTYKTETAMLPVESFTSYQASKTGQLPESSSIGYEDVQKEFASLASQIKSPEMQAAYGLKRVGGILLYGPPGCGKTYWANQLAKYLNYEIKELSRSDFASSYVDGAVKAISERIMEVEKMAPCVLFFDEFDDIAGQRAEENSAHVENSKTVNFLLQVIPKLIEKDIIIVAATNFIKKLDTAVIRGGRFDKKEPIFPPLPEERSMLLYNSMIKGLSQSSPVIQVLNKINANDLDFWLPFGTKMILFSNSYVEMVAQSIKRKMKDNEGTDFLLEDIIEESIEDISNSISYNEREDFRSFYNDLLENKFNKYENRLNNLKIELDIFFGGDHKNIRTPIGFKK